MGITILENWALDLMNDDMIRWVLDPRQYSFYIYFWFFLFFFHMQENLQVFIYKKNIKKYH
jgi:hypothetical protein